MKTYMLVSTMLILPLAACWAPKIPGDDGAEEMVGDGDGDSETGTDTGEETETGEPPVDLPEGDGDGDPGWCCECGTDPLSCTPSSLEACTAEGFEWCELDAEGNPSDCAAACEPEPEGWCCDCGAPTDTYPYFECWPSDTADCSYAWCLRNPLDGNLDECTDQCG